MKLVFNYWQEGSINTESVGFYGFCDALEVDNGKSAPASGWGLDHALKAWGAYWKHSFYSAGKFGSFQEMHAHTESDLSMRE